MDLPTRNEARPRIGLRDGALQQCRSQLYAMPSLAAAASTKQRSFRRSDTAKTQSGRMQCLVLVPFPGCTM